MLVEEPVGRREHATALPVEAPQLLLTLPPVEAVALAGDREYVEVGAMAMPLLIGADRHLGHVRMHGAVGEHEHDVAAARATRLPLL